MWGGESKEWYPHGVTPSCLQIYLRYGIELNCGVSNRRVVAMIKSGILEAEKFGEKVWMIDAESVKKRQEKMKGKKNED